MSDQPPKPIRKPTHLGQPIQWTDQDLDDLSAITPLDIELARQLWQKAAPRKYRNLLNAKTDEQETL